MAPTDLRDILCHVECMSASMSMVLHKSKVAGMISVILAIECTVQSLVEFGHRVFYKHRKKNDDGSTARPEVLESRAAQIHEARCARYQALRMEGKAPQW